MLPTSTVVAMRHTPLSAQQKTAPKGGCCYALQQSARFIFMQHTTADNIYPAFVWVYFGHQPAALEFPPAGGNKGIPARFAEHQSLGQEVSVFERFDEDLGIPGFQSSLIFDGDDARNRTPFLSNTNLFQRNPLQHAASLRSSRWYGGQGGGMPPFRPAEPSPRLNCTTLYHEGEISPPLSVLLFLQPLKLAPHVLAELFPTPKLACVNAPIPSEEL